MWQEHQSVPAGLHRSHGVHRPHHAAQHGEVMHRCSPAHSRQSPCADRPIVCLFIKQTHQLSGCKSAAPPPPPHFTNLPLLSSPPPLHPFSTPPLVSSPPLWLLSSPPFPNSPPPLPPHPPPPTFSPPPSHLLHTPSHLPTRSPSLSPFFGTAHLLSGTNQSSRRSCHSSDHSGYSRPHVSDTETEEQQRAEGLLMKKT